MVKDNNNAVCVTCGKPYHRCLSCDKLANNGIYTWRANCDTPTCFQVFMTALELRDGKITKEEAAGQLAAFDIDNILVADTSVKRILTPATDYMKEQAAAAVKKTAVKKTRAKKTK